MTDRRPAKADATLVVRGLRQCLTMAGDERGPWRAASQGNVGLVEEAAVAAAGDRILYAGPASGLLSRVRVAADAVRIDAEGSIAMPGFVDAHTHLLFGGWRPRELAQRLSGASYIEILAAGGGILSTVEATRVLSEEQLVQLGAARLRQMLELGTTTVEAKSGYGLSTADEAKLVRAARRLAATEPVDVVVTLLGAHALPREFRDDRAGYLKLVEQLIAQLADRIDFVDAFCEHGAFTVQECRRLFKVASKHGVAIKLHADQLQEGGGAALAAEFKATSADHLDHVSDAGIAALRKAGTVAVLLPSVPLYLGRAEQAPAAKLIEAEVPVALATDFNPGTSAMQSMGTIVALGCMLLRLTPEQALVAATRNAAFAVGRGDRVGSLAPGMQADLQLYDVDDYRMLPYRFGELRPRCVIKRGRVVVEESRA